MPVTGSLRPTVVSGPVESGNSMPEKWISFSDPSAGAWRSGRGISRDSGVAEFLYIVVPRSSSSVSRRRRDSLRIMRTATSGLSRSIWSNVEPLIWRILAGVRAGAEAARGMSSRIDISPKKSPFSRTAMAVSWSFIRLRISILPSWMMYISVPRSPSRKMYSPSLSSMRTGPPTALLAPPLVVLNTGLFMRCSSLAEPEPAVVTLRTGRQPQRESPVGLAMPAVEPPGHRHLQPGEAVGDQGRPVRYPTPIQMADDHARDPCEIIREPEVGQLTVDPVRRLVDVFPEHDGALQIREPGRAESRRQETQAAAEQRPGHRLLSRPPQPGAKRQRLGVAAGEGVEEGGLLLGCHPARQIRRHHRSVEGHEPQTAHHL